MRTGLPEHVGQKTELRFERRGHHADPVAVELVVEMRPEVRPERDHLGPLLPAHEVQAHRDRLPARRIIQHRPRNRHLHRPAIGADAGGRLPFAFPFGFDRAPDDDLGRVNARGIDDEETAVGSLMRLKRVQVETDDIVAAQAGLLLGLLRHDLVRLRVVSAEGDIDVGLVVTDPGLGGIGRRRDQIGIDEPIRFRRVLPASVRQIPVNHRGRSRAHGRQGAFGLGGAAAEVPANTAQAKKAPPPQRADSHLYVQAFGSMWS